MKLGSNTSLERFASKLVALATATMLISSSYGLMWQDYDYVSVYLGEGESYTGQFDITSSSGGYDQHLHELTHARVGFSFSDGYRSGDSGREWVDVWLDSSQIWNHREVDGTHRYGFDWIWRGLNGAMLADLQDGVMNYTVMVENRRDRRYNDVWFKEAKLKAWGNERPENHGVADSGASVWLLGISLLGAILFKKQVAHVSSETCKSR